MTIADITTGVQTDTATGAITGSLDTSAITGDFTVCLRCASMTDAQHVTVALEDTEHATPFSEALQAWVFHFKGAISPGAEVVHKLRKADLPGLRMGAANNKLRFNILKISGGTAKTHGWLEY